jgi:hypothetical protein
MNGHVAAKRVFFFGFSFVLIRVLVYLRFPL